MDAYQGGQAMVADGMRVQSDYNHSVGANVLRADLTVGWFSDPNHAVQQSLPETASDPEASTKVDNAWNTIDGSRSTGPR